jgi:hypothetical protein
LKISLQLRELDCVSSHNFNTFIVVMCIFIVIIKIYMFVQSSASVMSNSTCSLLRLREKLSYRKLSYRKFLVSQGLNFSFLCSWLLPLLLLTVVTWTNLYILAGQYKYKLGFANIFFKVSNYWFVLKKIVSSCLVCKLRTRVARWIGAQKIITFFMPCSS